MEHIKDLLPDPNTPKSLTDSPPRLQPSLDDRILTRVMIVLSAQYGSKWSTQVQTETSEMAVRKVWGEALVLFSKEQIMTALGKLPDYHPEWPPSVGEFKLVCKIGLDPNLVPASHQLDKPRDMKLALDSLAEMKKGLGVK